MKPGIGTILVSLLGGVLLAVAVAWHCIRAGPVARGEREFIAARTESGSIRQFVLLNTASRCGVEEIAFTATDSGAWWLARRGRGKRPRCAYQLRGTTVRGCPECGWRKALSERVM